MKLKKHATTPSGPSRLSGLPSGFLLILLNLLLIMAIIHMQPARGTSGKSDSLRTSIKLPENTGSVLYFLLIK